MSKNKFRKIAQEVILAEMRSLQKLKSSIDKSFSKAVELITNCKKGKIILSGVGKSGIIAKKYLRLYHLLARPLFCRPKFMLSWRLGSNKLK